MQINEGSGPLRLQPRAARQTAPLEDDTPVIRAGVSGSGALRDTSSLSEAALGATGSKARAIGFQVVQQNPELRDLMQQVKVGDVVLYTGSGAVSTMTGGDYTHAAICVEEGPPPKFIEAVGMTSTDAQRAGKVNKSDFFEMVSDTNLAETPPKPVNFKILRPSDDPKIVEAAVKYALSQEGKPYDFTFGDKANSLYCSRLVYNAYNVNRNPELRKALTREELKELQISGGELLSAAKSDMRDRKLVALNEMMRLYGIPKDEAGKVMQEFVLGSKEKAVKLLADVCNRHGLEGVGKTLDDFMNGNTLSGLYNAAKVLFGFRNAYLTTDETKKRVHNILGTLLSGKGVDSSFVSPTDLAAAGNHEAYSLTAGKR